MMPMVESMVVMPVSVLMRFGRYQDILALTAPAADRPVQRAWHHFARGTALAKTGKAEDAAAERKQLTAALASVPEGAAFGGGGWVDARTALNVAGPVARRADRRRRRRSRSRGQALATGGRGGRPTPV